MTYVQFVAKVADSIPTKPPLYREGDDRGETGPQGVSLASVEAGNGSSPLLFVHGWACDRTYVAPQVDHFRRTHRTIAVPALYIQADGPRPELERFGQLCPQLVIGRTVGAGHFHHLEVPDQVNAMIERFLAVSPPPA